MTTRRQRMRDVFAGDTPPVPPVSMRLELWHQDAAAGGTLPGQVRGLSLEQTEDWLGFCRAARYRAHPRIEFPEGWVTRQAAGPEARTTYRFPGAVLEKIEHRTPAQVRAGMRGAIVRFPVTDKGACRAMLEAMEHARLVAPIGGFDAFDQTVGDAGLPVLILGSCPAHALMLEWFGYEWFFYAQADFPDELAELVAALDALYRRDVWGAALGTPAELILHGNHFADATTPPPLFGEFFLPYFCAFNAQAHAAGKRVLWHADAAMGSLLDLVIEADFDGADCLATDPLVPETLDDYTAAWGDRIVCWGGLPGTVFDPAYPRAAFDEQLRSLRRAADDGARLIVGASDNVMPGACWDRVLAVSRAFAP